MALIIKTDRTFKNVHFKSGWFYHFTYKNWQNDPYPHIIFINSVQGINPNTSHKWDLIQGINFSYIPRPRRMIFLKDWINMIYKFVKKSAGVKGWEYNSNPALIYGELDNMMRYNHPYLMEAFRRYLTLPNGLITTIREIPPDKVKETIMNTMQRDFSGRFKSPKIKHDARRAELITQRKKVKKAVLSKPKAKPSTGSTLKRYKPPKPKIKSTGLTLKRYYK